MLNLSEQSVLHESLKSWLDALQAEALRQAGTHPLWKQIAVRFDSELGPQARDRFATEFRAFELKEIRRPRSRRASALVAGVEDNPALLYTLRGGKFALDLTIIGGVIYRRGRGIVGVVPAAGPARRLRDAQFAEMASRGVAEGARTASGRTGNRSSPPR